MPCAMYRLVDTCENFDISSKVNLFLTSIVSNLLTSNHVFELHISILKIKCVKSDIVKF